MKHLINMTGFGLASERALHTWHSHLYHGLHTACTTCMCRRALLFKNKNKEERLVSCLWENAVYPCSCLLG